jgi:hypothetical protein
MRSARASVLRGEPFFLHRDFKDRTLLGVLGTQYPVLSTQASVL